MNVGIASNLYGTPKGHSYVIRDFVNMLKDNGHTVHMYRIGGTDILEEFPEPDSLVTEPTRIIPEDKFVNWALDKKLDYCIFMEYSQWWEEDHDKIKICNDIGIKPVGFLVYEKLDWDKTEHYKQYHRIICPTRFQTKLMRKNGIYNAVHIPWGVNKEEIDSVEEPPRDKDGKIRFYHCAGSGGVGDRKNTEAVIKAFKQLHDDDLDLKISHLGSKIFNHKEIISFMKYADVIINTAKWDTIGLNTLEANMAGRPVIVVNMDPMNELVKENVNGFLINGEETTNPNVTCPVFNVDIDELSKKMATCKNEIILNILKSNSRKFAEANFDWEKNKEHFLKIFK